jgi:glycosyltransferase involved in cell wall biosynthesis
MKRISVIAPHFQEYSLLFANALSRHAPVRLFIDLKRLKSEYGGRDMPVAPDVTIQHVGLNSILDVFRILSGMFRSWPSDLFIQEASGLLKSVILACVVTVARPFCKIILTVHDPVPHGGRDAAIAGRLDRFRRYVRGRAHVVLVHGQFCYDEYIASHSFPNQKVYITEHGVILSDGDAAIAPSAPFSILFFGRMEEYKGVDVLCEAAELLNQENVNFRLRVAGRGPEIDRLQQRYERIPGVEVLNTFVPAKGLVEAIEDADCVVLPYLSATQSGVLAGAFANGRFVVASRVGGIPDIVTHMEDGILVPPNDPRALADALKLAASDRTICERLKAGARRTAETRLRWDHIVDNLRTVY